MNLIDFTATELLTQLNAGSISAEEVTQSFLDRITACDDQVGVFLFRDGDAALQQARDIDRRRNGGNPVGKLAGLPVAVKDNMCVTGSPTTCASRMLDHFRPPYSATVGRKLLEEDAILIGKTNLDEFAMGGTTENSSLKATHNPWDLQRVPGGSSGGAAACIAAAMAPLSVGSDTGGSIRQPAALCGVVGMKPTYGLVSRYGLVAFASSFDQIGPITRSVKDSAIVLSVISGHDPRDSTSIPLNKKDYTNGIDKGVKGLKVGIAKEYFEDGIDPATAEGALKGIKKLQELGAEIVEISLPNSRNALAVYYIIAPSECSANLARYDGVKYGFSDQQSENMWEALAVTRKDGFGPEVKRRIRLGTYALSAGYYEAY